MRLIKPSFEIWEQTDGLYKHIERAGRVCYKSEEKITEDSAYPFVEKLMQMGHNSVLEHGTVYLKAKTGTIHEFKDDPYAKYKSSIRHNPLEKYCHNKYSYFEQHVFAVDTYLYVTTNLRVLVENNWLQDLDYLCAPTDHHTRRITVRFITDRATANEFVRHREFSFSQESTRYCNYANDKFGRQLTFIEPYWFAKHDRAAGNFLTELALIEDTYLGLLKKGLAPQQARQILPLALKTELVMTGTVDAWKRFFRLRCSPQAHPDAQLLANGLCEEFLKRRYIYEA